MRSKREPKKLPQDYPQLAFRISEEDKKTLMSRVKSITEALNRGRDEDTEYAIRNNDVILAAIKLGLPLVTKKHFKR